ncbi:MAG TPA: hypothetical protein VGM90_26500 [Kofleriaceae bacterium]
MSSSEPRSSSSPSLFVPQALPENAAPAVAVLAEGTAPVAIPYHPEPRRRMAAIVALGAGAAVVVASLAIGSTMISRSDTRAMTKRFPITATPAEKSALAAGAATWSRGKRTMLSTISHDGLPSLADLKGVGACTIVHARSDDELAIEPASALDDSDLAISRGRRSRRVTSTRSSGCCSRPSISSSRRRSARAFVRRQARHTCSRSSRMHHS